MPRRKRPRVPPRIFLLSPANCGGPRAKMVVSPNARFELAQRLRGGQGVAIGDVREQHGRDVGVVLNQIALRDSQVGPERLVEIGEVNLGPLDAERRRAGGRNAEPRGHCQILKPCMMPRIFGSRGGRGPWRTAPSTGT